MNRHVIELSRLANQGDADSQYDLADCYSLGVGVDQDRARAAMWYRKAAEQGHAKAQFDLGESLFFGWGITKDMKEAVVWFRRAAEQGHPKAQMSLGVCLDYGDGTPMDGIEAHAWYLKAAEQGETHAMHMLGACYARGAPCVNLAIFNLKNATASEDFQIPRDVVEGLAFFSVAADKDPSYLWNAESLKATMTPEQIRAGKIRAVALQKEFEMKQAGKQG